MHFIFRVRARPGAEIIKEHHINIRVRRLVANQRCTWYHMGASRRHPWYEHEWQLHVTILQADSITGLERDLAFSSSGDLVKRKW